MVNFFKTIRNNKSNQVFSLDIQLEDDHFTLKILENQDAWLTDVTKEDLNKKAEPFDVSKEEYFSKLKTYFFETPKNVEFRFTDGEFSCYIKTQRSNFVYFSAKLRKVNIDFVELLEIYSSEGERLRLENDNLTKERDKLREDNNNLENKLKELVAKKIQEEEELYSHFTLVLNEKKRKIQHLNQTLQAFKAGRPTVNSERVVKTKSVPLVRNDVSESENSDYNTDEEKTVNKVKSKEPLPSTSTVTNSNMYSDDDNDDIILPKRTKVTDSKLSHTGYELNNIPSINKVIAKEKTPEPEPEEKISEPAQVQSMNDSPTFEISTQELLDRL
ncbi:unnamed protein product [Phyllotreta striolata]|uniref:Uncharacterized protein n=1 Tax=Phyllotreta striolata TaxID=444603 RepID=A0A9N9TQP7_PHYSR|nr:unnamed protein product [Phyllotreta striolata]